MNPRMKSWALVVGAVLAGAVAATCGPDDPEPPDAGPDARVPFVEEDSGTTDPPAPPERCALALDKFKKPGSGVSAKKVESPGDLIGGPTAAGKVGDFLLQNDKVKVIVQGQDRHIGPQPYGGTFLDADLVHAGPGRDQLGEIGLLYNFGRTVEPTFFEILSDGSAGGPAIVATSGRDAQNDYLDIRNQLKKMLGNVPQADPYLELPLKITNYFILNPGEQKVRMVTAFCNEGEVDAVLAVGSVSDPGQSYEFFNGLSCTGGFGYGGTCFGIDRMSWYGFQYDGVAYGWAPYGPGAPSQPSAQNTLLTISGVSGAIYGSAGLQGLLEWFDPKVTTRASELRIPPHQTRATAVDLVVGKDIGEVASIVEASRNELTATPTAIVNGTVTANGAPVPDARVSFVHDTQVVAVLFADASGRYSGTLTAGGPYSIAAWAPGRIPSAEKQLTLSSTAANTVDFTLGEKRRLTVNVTEAGGAAMPAKVTVLCGSGSTCASKNKDLSRFTDVAREPLPDNVAAVVFASAQGVATVDLAPGQYSVLVSRGPEWSLFPNGYPTKPALVVDLSTADQTVNAALAHVVDSTGWQSADFHVHAVNSPDSYVDNLQRALSYAAEGVDVIVATDHDYVTDFAPYIEKLGAQSFLASVVGEEVSPMGFGHYNLFPLTAVPGDQNGGAVDWAGYKKPTLSPALIFAEGRKKGAATVHFNHPRGTLGGFTHLLVDTDTLASHADPKDFGMAMPPGGTLADSLLFSTDFNAIEILNGGDNVLDIPNKVRPQLNDWFTLLSRGFQIAGTGVSDTHHRFSAAAGYCRTFVKTGQDTPANFDSQALSAAVNAMKAVATDAPFVTVTATRLDSAGKPTGTAVGMGETLEQGAGQVQVTVRTQVPEYADVTKIELYTWTPGDDGRCPIDPTSAQAKTTRVACNGVSNVNWPASGIAATRTVTLGAANLVTAANVGGVAYKRWDSTEVFKLPAPAKDTWIVVMVYGTKSLFPLMFGAVPPFAVTNPVFVDADGNGYDNPPFNSSLPAREQPRQPTDWSKQPMPYSPVVTTPRRPTAQEFLETWDRMQDHH